MRILLACLACALPTVALAEVAQPKAPPPAPGSPARPPVKRDPDDLRLPDTTKPSAEIVLHYKRVAGAWTCKGTAARSDGSSSPVAGRVVVKLDLDNAWIVTTFRETTGPLKWTEYRTHDAAAKTWTKVQLVNTSGHVVSTSSGEAKGEIVWTGTAKSPHGSVQLKDHEKVEPKQLTLWGEAQLGNAWQKIYQVVCRR